jgi:hypothetical protein
MPNGNTNQDYPYIGPREVESEILNDFLSNYFQSQGAEIDTTLDNWYESPDVAEYLPAILQTFQEWAKAEAPYLKTFTPEGWKEAEEPGSANWRQGELMSVIPSETQGQFFAPDTVSLPVDWSDPRSAQRALTLFLTELGHGQSHREDPTKKEDISKLLKLMFPSGHIDASSNWAKRMWRIKDTEHPEEEIIAGKKFTSKNVPWHKKPTNPHYGTYPGQYDFKPDSTMTDDEKRAKDILHKFGIFSSGPHDTLNQLIKTINPDSTITETERKDITFKEYDAPWTTGKELDTDDPFIKELSKLEEFSAHSIFGAQIFDRVYSAYQDGKFQNKNEQEEVIKNLKELLGQVEKGYQEKESWYEYLFGN